MSTFTEKKTYSLKVASEHISALKPGSEFTLTGLFGSSKAYLLASAFNSLRKPILAILPDQESAEDFADDIKFFLKPEDVFLYPCPEVLPFEQQPAHQEIQSARMELLFNLLKQRPFITITSAANLMQKVMPKDSLGSKLIDIKKDVEYQRDELILKLQEIGYLRMSMVEERGEMSIRGGILDIFPPMHDLPLRIEFFGDEVESIRTFDISSQRSLKELDEARILPARETTLAKTSRFDAREKLMERADILGINRDAWEPLSDKIREGSIIGMDALLPLFYDKLDTIFDYLQQDSLITIIEPELVSPALDKFSTEVRSSVQVFISKKKFFVAPGDLYLGSDETRALLKNFPIINFEALRGSGAEVSTESNIDLRQEISLRKGEELLTPLADRVRQWTGEGQRVYLTAHNKGPAERTKELLEGYGFNPKILKSQEILESSGSGFAIVTGSLSSGFRFPVELLVIISEEEVFGERVKRRAPPSKKLDAFLTQLQDLANGDYTVHKLHGIGLYKGLKRLNIDNVENEFLLLEYRGGDKLYVPVSRMDLVSKYHGLEGRAPELDKLGGPGWEKTKKKVKQAVEKLAGELLKLYAEREVAEGFAFSPPDRLFHEFEAGFEYEETPDQARAIEETLKDMEEARPMDRLVCGDVGYGKTEVAIRAAFKAVLDKKQVAVLVPTTVLAQQHFRTFSKRLASYPVVVEVLSRFRSPKEQKDVVKRLGEGKVDIIIGTHRLLSKDIEFKDLGLIVIDEEHRFGVAHKEKLKQLRKKVDVLTLTATPIPRTLHMSLASIRELSIINTPPEDRLAIKTYVTRFDEPTITEAIERELNRGGQVFFVHNRIQSMGAIDEFLRRIMPRARIAVAHGQMNEHELEKKMLGFINKDFDILLSTAIIESGLDIPTANTIIINRADRFGLAELYQLRGRVGRSKHRAYAYCICPSINELTDDARKRIEVIQELSDPGSGFKIASYDLEIRGAGELLGTAQSGQIAEVGFDMYTQLLEEAVRNLRGEEVEEDIEPEINLKVSQYIPEEYIPDTRHRLSFYKRLASINSEAEIHETEEELIDRYGEIPALLKNFIEVVGLKLLLKRLKARELTQRGTRLYFTFEHLGDSELGKKISAKALKLMKEEPRHYRITPDSQFIVYMQQDTNPIEESRYILKEFLKG
ncbi:MAG: transcription-repair coupling factor [Deltaproteobacteria bacterium]|nr:transcription-repair coupling factor [Deltaproteobacteria bacterium]